MSADRFSLLVADNHPVILEGVSGLVSAAKLCSTVARATSGGEALVQIAALRPDVVLIDAALPDRNALEILEAQRETGKSATRIILFADTISDADIRAAVELGVAGLVFKNAPTDDVLAALVAVAKGQTWLQHERVQAALARDEAEEAPAGPLVHLMTGRELELIDLARRGYATRQMAQTMGVSEGTVKVHFYNIFRKAGVRSRAELVALVNDNFAPAPESRAKANEGPSASGPAAGQLPNQPSFR